MPKRRTEKPGRQKALTGSKLSGQKIAEILAAIRSVHEQ
jgi:hypothetical protein